ncbi:MAG: excinuclease ABC subunit UvrC [Proteobacteria bacterium]|nr:excinuclease ABC subunit UvrC [Pseudomonadota bacterium]NCA28679.1 excinuclease ABC subunit UvrC [Pseudomonadota bacterium]
MPFDIIKSQLPNIPKSSGVYKFIDSKESVLYVGKAKNLFKRVSSYMNKNSLSNRIIRMITLAHKVEYIITKSEVEALLLEHNLIKKLSPNFNILLKDDKTFPQILISNHRFPQISKYRGLKNNKGQYFGPFVYAGDVNRTIEIIRKNFQLRSCSDQEFKMRTKPCLEYQIKKCSAPCVGYISASDYAENVKNSVDVLTGKSQQVQEIFRQQMLELSKKMEYEKALILRDKIKSLDSIQTKQNINFEQAKNIDLIVASEINGRVCVYISFYRLGQNYGARPYFYEIENGTEVAEVLSGFIGQFYLSENPPAQLIIDREIADKELLEQYLCAIINKKVEIIIPKQGDKLNLVKDNQKIAWQILDQKISHNLSTKKLLLELKKVFDLPRIPRRIEVYDNSHTSFENAVGAMITAGEDGFIKSGYRKFNIKNEIADGSTKMPADDTQMLKQVLFRRFSKLQKKDFPDFIIIDGGKGQLSSASEIFENLGIKIPFVCMSKGKNRNAGEEFFHQIDKESFTLEKNSPVMHYLQRLRDEAHRFAIMTHRKKRDKDFLKN